MPKQLQLLVIDDQRLDRAIAAHAAARAGFCATTVSGITDARRLLEGGGRFEFVILDLLLGGEDGLEALRLLARFDKTASVLFVSGLDGRVLSASQRLASILGLRVAGILRKPFVPAALIA